MLDVYERAKSECNYDANRFHREVTTTGGLAVAKEQLASDTPRNGLLILHRLGRLDISTEAMALDQRFRELFTEEELARARNRLQCLNYNAEGIG